MQIMLVKTGTFLRVNLPKASEAISFGKIFKKTYLILEIGRIFEEDTLAAWNGALNLYHGNTLYMLHGVHEVKKINILVPSTSSINTQANISSMALQLFTTNLAIFEVCLIYNTTHIQMFIDVF